MTVGSLTKFHRTCGPCTLCCTVLGVAELRKPKNVRCEHIANHRCGIYAQRPQSCKDFSCLWLLGVLPVHLRPDKTRVVPDVTAHGEILVFHMAPQDFNAHKKPAFKKWLDSRGNISVITICGGIRQAYGPIAKEIEDGRANLAVVKVDGMEMVQLERRR